MLKLKKHESDGYFRTNETEDFPWEDRGQHIWFSLITSENKKVQKYGFKSTYDGKTSLHNALLDIDKVDDALLIGVWNGKWCTHLFILDIPIAIQKIKEYL